MTILAATILILPVAAEPMPQAKVGRCPADYRDSVGYCAPMSDRGLSFVNVQELNPYNRQTAKCITAESPTPRLLPRGNISFSSMNRRTSRKISSRPTR